jgi:hypothetical protein
LEGKDWVVVALPLNPWLLLPVEVVEAEGVVEVDVETAVEAGGRAEPLLVLLLPPPLDDVTAALIVSSYST